jgi:DNA ligase-associated metallophosphoesterase
MIQKNYSLEWQGEQIALLPDRAMYWPKKKTVYIADTHFGKAATFRKAGIPVSEHTTEEDLLRISKMIQQTKADRLVILGDFLHARAGRTQPVRNLLFDWRDHFKSLNIVLIRGNHDLQSGDPWPELGIECLPDPTAETPWVLRHLPGESSTRPFIAGHLHPGYRIQGKARDSLRCSCWVIGPGRIIMPAFGSFTGLKNVRLNSGETAYLTNGEEIYSIP